MSIWPINLIDNFKLFWNASAVRKGLLTNDWSSLATDTHIRCNKRKKAQKETQLSLEKVRTNKI